MASHIGGPITSGAGTVLIGYHPAARVTDTAICVPATDVIAAGAVNVIVEHHPAARLGDPTVHGAVIVTGCPTVIIGTMAQSLALTAAATNGAPICEECERARREAAARAAREAAAPNDAAPNDAPAPAAPAPAEQDGPAAEAPTEDEAAQASAPGSTLEQRAAREKVARAFYAQSGLGSARADVDLGVGGVPPRPNLHPKGFGIDLSQPVSVVELPETLTQVLPSGAPPGNVFAAPLAGALPGAPTAARPVTFSIPAGRGLLSTSGPGAGGTPGALQITVPDAVLRHAACTCCGQTACDR